MMGKNSLNLTFLGTSGGIQVPSFHCSCRTCEDARKNPGLSFAYDGLRLDI